MWRVGIVGHRNLGGPEAIELVKMSCLSILKEAVQNHGEVLALSALAEGADTLFAEAGCSLGLPLEVVRPFESYSSDFTDADARARYEQLRSTAARETVLPFRERSTEAYVAAMRWILDHSDLLVVAWDGQAAAGPGGTAEAAELRMQEGDPWVHLDVSNLSVQFHSGGLKSI